MHKYGRLIMHAAAWKMPSWKSRLIIQMALWNRIKENHSQPDLQFSIYAYINALVCVLVSRRIYVHRKIQA